MQFSLEKTLSDSSILSCIEEYGVCVIPNYLSPDELISLQQEFDHVQGNQEIEGFLDHGSREYMKVTKVFEPALERSTFNAIKKLVAHQRFRTLTRRFYGKDYIYPQKIFFVRSTHTPDSANELPYCLHFDKFHMLKFFFLLSDTDEECGPTQIMLGLHKQNCEKRRAWRENGGNVHKIENKLNSLDGRVISLTGKAGTLVILDTDVPHKAGAVKDGRVRKVIRIDTTCPMYSGVGFEAVPSPRGILSRVINKISFKN